MTFLHSHTRTFSLSHFLILSRSHVLTLSLSHALTFSRSHVLPDQCNIPMDQSLTSILKLCNELIRKHSRIQLLILKTPIPRFADIIRLKIFCFKNYITPSVIHDKG